jgi:hypothetical protein
MYLLQDIFDEKFRPRHTFYMPGGAATCVAFMLCTHGQNHCTRLAAGSEEGMLMIFDVDRGHQLTALNVCAFGTETVHTVAALALPNSGIVSLNNIMSPVLCLTE